MNYPAASYGVSKSVIPDLVGCQSSAVV